MERATVHTLIATQELGWLSLLYAHLWKNGFAPLSIAPTCASALALSYQYSPRLVLVDTNLSDFSAIDLCIALVQTQPTAMVVLITNSDAESPTEALQAGVSACLHRDLPLMSWPALLASVLNDESTIGHRLLDSMVRPVITKQPSSSIRIQPIHFVRR